MITHYTTRRPTPKKFNKIRGSEKPLKLCHGRMYVCGEGGGLVVRLSVFNADVVNVSTINCESDFCDVSILPYFDVLFSCCFIHPHKKYEDITSSHQAKKIM